jgi:hypothetical protein
MRVIRVTAKAGPDGCFHLKLPLDSPEQLYDVAIVIAVRPPEEQNLSPEELGWKAGHLESVLGSIDDPMFKRDPQGEFEVREPLD